MGKAEKKLENEVFISEADQYLFAQGTHYDIYKKLGAHPSTQNGEKGMFFGVCGAKCCKCACDRNI